MDAWNRNRGCTSRFNYTHTRLCIVFLCVCGCVCVLSGESTAGVASAAVTRPTQCSSLFCAVQMLSLFLVLSHFRVCISVASLVVSLFFMFAQHSYVYIHSIHMQRDRVYGMSNVPESDLAPSAGNTESQGNKRFSHKFSFLILLMRFLSFVFCFWLVRCGGSAWLSSTHHAKGWENKKYSHRAFLLFACFAAYFFVLECFCPWYIAVQWAN